MNFDPSLKLSTYPSGIISYFIHEASTMRHELENNKLHVYLKPSDIGMPNKVRYVESHNAAWYSEFVFNKCADFSTIQKRRKRYKRKTGGSIRQKTMKALTRIVEGKDGKQVGKHYSYDYDLRLLIFERLCGGYYLTTEGYAEHPEGGVPPNVRIRDFFNIETLTVTRLPEITGLPF